ncbi:MAG TPA: lipid-A-disaccharide synthase, partial [Candidatus Binatia bacterium]|nr:lipid-A-disaccharide synthase [Candidatus Binatia bacterium]
MSARVPQLMLVAGEASGDLHGAALARALQVLAPDVRLYGMGGPRMAEAGVRLLVDARDTAVVGFSEVIRALPALRRVFRRLAAALQTDRPDALVLVDFPGLNLRLARVAHAARVPVVYFVAPQIWAWRPGRIETIRRYVSLVLAVLPFEPPIYARAGVRAIFVGHPVLDEVAAAPARSQARRALGVGDAEPVVGLLPGSRQREIERLAPLMRDAARIIRASRPGSRFVVALAPAVEPEAVAAHLAGGPPLQLHRGAHTVMRAADVLIVASGTATLEAALLGTPMVVCYRVSWVSEIIGRAVSRVPWISLVNLVLGRAVVPELWRRSETT